MIEIKNLNKWYGNLHVIKDLNLKVEKGEIFGLLGPNGAGKTTLIKILTGQTRARGFVRVYNINPIKNPLEVKKIVGIVPESESVPNYLTTEEYLYFVAEVRKIKEDAVEKMIKKFDLGNYRNVVCKNLSKGTKQRLMFAAALIHNPKILFLDEPFINLDPIYQRKVREIIEKFVNEGNTIFMATHILEIAEKLCSRVGIIMDGKIVKIVKDMKNLEQIFLREVGYA